jgi:hypothetical protein
MLNAETKRVECEMDLREWNIFCKINQEVKYTLIKAGITKDALKAVSRV